MPTLHTRPTPDITKRKPPRPPRAIPSPLVIIHFTKYIKRGKNREYRQKTLHGELISQGPEGVSVRMKSGRVEIVEVEQITGRIG